jgi:hypothetical protein
VGLLCHMEDEHHAEANAGVLSLRKLANFFPFLEYVAIFFAVCRFLGE